MVIIDRLIRGPGEARALLGFQDSEELLDISDDAWHDRLEIVKDVRFDKVRLHGTEVLVEFVDCKFERSRFSALRSVGHFWAAANSWNECVFEGVALDRPFSPVNTFTKCEFVDVSLNAYRPYQTLFEACKFVGASFQAMRTNQVLNSTSLNSRLADQSATLVFRDCTFLRTQFIDSRFEGAAFENCRFVESTAVGCDFSGALGVLPWSAAKPGDPFLGLVDRLLELFDRRLGAGSEAASVMRQFRTDYELGKVDRSEFPKLLRANPKSKKEWQRVSFEAIRLMEDFE